VLGTANGRVFIINFLDTPKPMDVTPSANPNNDDGSGNGIEVIVDESNEVDLQT
jgi:hypothetical protein